MYRNSLTTTLHKAENNIAQSKQCILSSCSAQALHLREMSIFAIGAEHHTFPHKLKCELCHDRISIMCIDHNAALSGQTGFKCQACWARMKTNIQNSLSEAQIAPTIGMQYPLQPLAFKHASMQHTNDCRLHRPYKEDSL